MHRTAFAVDGIRRRREARPAARRDHETQVPTGATARDAEFFGIDAILARIGPDEAHRPQQVAHDLDVKARLRAVDNDKGGVSSLCPRSAGQVAVTGAPAAAHDADAGAVGLGGCRTSNVRATPSCLV